MTGTGVDQDRIGDAGGAEQRAQFARRTLDEDARAFEQQEKPAVDVVVEAHGVGKTVDRECGDRFHVESHEIFEDVLARRFGQRGERDAAHLG